MGLATDTFRCLYDTTRIFAKAASTLIGSFWLFIVTVSTIALAHYSTEGPLYNAWFLIASITIGSILAVLGISSQCSDTALHVYTGASLILIPFEAAIVLLYTFDEAELHKWADQDDTKHFKHVLSWVDEHLDVSIAVAAVILTLQASTVVLVSCIGCCSVKSSSSSGAARQRNMLSWGGEGIYYPSSDMEEGTSTPSSLTLPLLPPQLPPYIGGGVGGASPPYLTPRDHEALFTPPVRSPARRTTPVKKKALQSFPVTVA